MQYTTQILGKVFVVFPGVFSPKYFHNTVTLFASYLPITSGDELLEIGCGTGVISILAIYRGAKRVLAVDINPQAVLNTRENIRLHDLEKSVEVREGNVYDAVNGCETFDLIAWNLPFGVADVDEHLTISELALYDPGYNATRDFVVNCDQFLKPTGRVYVGFSTSMGDLQRLQDICASASRFLHLVFEQSRGGVRFQIFELVKKRPYIGRGELAWTRIRASLESALQRVLPRRPSG